MVRADKNMDGLVVEVGRVYKISEASWLGRIDNGASWKGGRAGFGAN